jgi:hypothetical protein
MGQPRVYVHRFVGGPLDGFSEHRSEVPVEILIASRTKDIPFAHHVYRRGVRGGRTVFYKHEGVRSEPPTGWPNEYKAPAREAAEARRAARRRRRRPAGS